MEESVGININIISEYSGMLKGRVKSGCNNALTDVVLVGMRCVREKYVWSFTD